MTGRLFAVATIVLLAAAVVLGWGAGDMQPPPPAPADRTAWSLPRVTHNDTGPELAALKTRHPWSGLFSFAPNGGGSAGAALGAAPAAAGPPPPSWRLAGIVERGDDRFALVASGTGTTANLAYLRVGDHLPDGSTLVRIAGDSATAADAKSPAQRRVYRLFGEKR